VHINCCLRFVYAEEPWHLLELVVKCRFTRQFMVGCDVLLKDIPIIPCQSHLPLLFPLMEMPVIR